jgi:hypothetical protein
MTLVAGIDPGTNGAVAVYCTEIRRIVSVIDIPTWFQTVGAKKRKRIDNLALMEMFDTLKMMGVELVVIEAVGGRPRQSASAAFVFGYTVGLLYSGCMYHQLMIETVPPQRWKKVLNVPGKQGGKDASAKKQAQGDIMNRVNELFPNDRDLFRTERGAYRMDRADAALLAKFGGDFVWATMAPIRGNDDELKLVYRNAETGA